MFFRVTSLILALLIGVPLCLCCVAQPTFAVETETCSACHKFAEPEEQAPAQPPASGRDGTCCKKLLQRNISPDTATAPRLVLVDLETWVWQRPESFDFLSWLNEQSHVSLAAAETVAPPRHAVPLFQQHCVLLL